MTYTAQCDRSTGHTYMPGACDLAGAEERDMGEQQDSVTDPAWEMLAGLVDLHQPDRNADGHGGVSGFCAECGWVWPCRSFKQAGGDPDGPQRPLRIVVEGTVESALQELYGLIGTWHHDADTETDAMYAGGMRGCAEDLKARFEGLIDLDLLRVDR